MAFQRQRQLHVNQKGQSMFATLERPPPITSWSLAVPDLPPPPTDRLALRAQAAQRLADLLEDLEGVEGLSRLERIGSVAPAAQAAAKSARTAAYDAALSAAFYDGVQGLHLVLGTAEANWLQTRRRALKSPAAAFMRSASPEEVAARARELGLPQVPDALERLPELGHDHVETEEWWHALRDVRDDLVRSLYSASVLNPGGITQPMLARAAGMAEQRVWQLINPSFRAHRDNHGNRRLYPPRDKS